MSWVPLLPYYYTVKKKNLDYVMGVLLPKPLHCKEEELELCHGCLYYQSCLFTVKNLNYVMDTFITHTVTL